MCEESPEQDVTSTYWQKAKRPCELKGCLPPLNEDI